MSRRCWTGPSNDGEQREKFLSIVAKHTERLHAILEDLLTLARVEQEGEKPENVLAGGSLRGVLEAAVADCASEGRGKEHASPVDLPRRAHGRDERLAAGAGGGQPDRKRHRLQPAGPDRRGIRLRRASARSRSASATTAAASPASICRGSSSGSTASTSRGAATPAAPVSGWPSSSTSSSSTAAGPPSRVCRPKAARSPSSCRSSQSRCNAPDSATSIRQVAAY